MMSDNSADLGPKLVTSVWILTILATIFLSLRVFCKFLGHRRLWWDDYVLIASWVCIWIDTILLQINVGKGYGKHTMNIDPANIPTLSLFGNIIGVAAILGTVWSKTSFALTLLRISNGWISYAIWIIIISMNVFMTLSAIFLFAHCTPVQKTWNRRVEGTCWPDSAFVDYAIFAGAWSGAMDIILSLLPSALIYNLQMRTQEKIGVAVAMSMGIFAGATAIIKCVKLPNLAGNDFLYEIIDLTIWGHAELATTIMAASIPVLRTLIRQVKILNSRKSYQSGSTSDTIRGTPRYDTVNKRPDSNNVINTVTVTAQNSRSKSRNNNNDDASGQSILHGAENIGISKSYEVEVNCKERNDTSSMGYEMENMKHCTVSSPI